VTLARILEGVIDNRVHADRAIRKSRCKFEPQNLTLDNEPAGYGEFVAVGLLKGFGRALPPWSDKATRRTKYIRADRAGSESGKKFRRWRSMARTLSSCAGRARWIR
jgi:hypothetical protein